MAADEKTEQATPKKRRDERKKGNIFLSKDVVVVVSLLGTFFSLKLLFPSMYEALSTFLLRYMSYAYSKTEVTAEFISDMTIEMIITFVRVCVPLLMIAVLLAVIATAAQTKLLFSTDALKPKFSRLSPLQGFKKMFSSKSIVEVVKGIIKISILIYIIYDFFMGQLINFEKTLKLDLISSSAYILDCVIKLVMKVSIAFVVISAFDYLYQWWDYERQLKMSKQEVKEEYKQTEGNPQIKGKIKELQRRMAMSRMMQSVPDADVVLRNPTHFAVALKYDGEKDIAPIVVAKGQDEIALRIVKIAEENGVQVVENKPIARALYAMTQVSGTIPEEFYGTIAEILVYVYKLDGKDLTGKKK